jgi:hypothetical protein
VSARCGVLLGPQPEAEEIAEAMARVAFADDHARLRANARQTIEAGFDAARNYRDFVADIVALGAIDDSPAHRRHRAAPAIQHAAGR